MRPTIDLDQSSISAYATTLAQISALASNGDDGLLLGDVDTTLSAHEMLDSSARTFAEQRDQVMVQGAGFPPQVSHVDDSYMMEHGLCGGDDSELVAADEMASLGWQDLNL